MIRRVILCPAQLWHCRCMFSQGTSNPPTKCAIPVGMDERLTTMTSGVHACPVVGAVPQLNCPLETLNATQPPSLRSIASQMGKVRLSTFVTATAMAGYILCGGATPVVLIAVGAGTLLQSCSANTANQVVEAKYDAIMKRTCRRPIPAGVVTRKNALFLCAVELLLGSFVLGLVNPTVAALGAANWVLYVAVYTPLKRVSAVNTWVGSIVGAVPPLMGGVAAAGTVTAPAALLGTLLLVWQIPHFMGLSFHCRRDYKAAGYKMLVFYNPWRASLYAVLMSLLMAIITIGGPDAIGITVEVWYYPTVLVANAVMVYKAWLFHSDPKLHCRGCFVFSYVYLSIVLTAFVLNHAEPVGKLIALCRRLGGNPSINVNVDTSNNCVAEAEE
ncbi:protoheme IX farnesyltransferase [Trypanosoma vivax]|nr:protoheme IX farnesyltransferase [Trypanosoma vivax]